MSGSPVYIDGRLVGAVSYQLGQFSKEPIAGITPISRDDRRHRAGRHGPGIASGAPGPRPRRDPRRTARRVAPRARPGAAVRGVGGRGAGHGDGRRLPPALRHRAAADRRSAGDQRVRARRARRAGAEPAAGGLRPGPGAGGGQRRSAARSADARARRCGRRRAAVGRLRPRRDRHGHRGRRRPRLRLRPSALQPRADRVPDDAGRHHRGAALAGELDQARQPRRRRRHRVAGSRNGDCRPARPGAEPDSGRRHAELAARAVAGASRSASPTISCSRRC